MGAVAPSAQGSRLGSRRWRSRETRQERVPLLRAPFPHCWARPPAAQPGHHEAPLLSYMTMMELPLCWTQGRVAAGTAGHRVGMGRSPGRGAPGSHLCGSSGLTAPAGRLASRQPCCPQKGGEWPGAAALHTCPQGHRDHSPGARAGGGSSWGRGPTGQVEASGPEGQARPSGSGDHRQQSPGQRGRSAR